MMVDSHLGVDQLQRIVERTIVNADKDGDGQLSFEEFKQVSLVTDLVCLYSRLTTILECPDRR